MRFKKLLIIRDFLIFLTNPVLFPDMTYVELEGGVRTPSDANDGTFVFEDVNTFLIGILDGSVLDLEFFESFDELTVEICDDYGRRLFFETIDTIKGVHIIADLSNKDSWTYHVHVYNSHGVNVYAEFKL